MNPPFGTKVKGADVDFLRTAFAIASGAGGHDGPRAAESDESNPSTSTMPKATNEKGDTQPREKTVIYSLHKTRCEHV